MAINSSTLRSFLAAHIDQDAAITFHLKDGNVFTNYQLQALHECSVELYNERISQLLFIDLDFVGYVEVQSVEILLVEED